jgi:hypothetical protein
VDNSKKSPSSLGKFAHETDRGHISFFDGIDEFYGIHSAETQQNIPTTHGIWVGAFQQQHLAFNHETLERHWLVEGVGDDPSAGHRTGPGGE